MTTAIDKSAIEGLSSAVVVSAQRGGVEIIDELAAEWRDLCDVAANDQPFYRPEFVQAHIRKKIPGARVVIITARLDNRLELALPLVEELGRFGKVPLRKLRAPVDFNCGRFDGVRRSGEDGDAAIRATWNYLKNDRGWDLLEIPDTPEGEHVLSARGRGADGWIFDRTTSRNVESSSAGTSRSGDSSEDATECTASN